MPGPVSSQDFVTLVRRSGLVDRQRLEAYLNQQAAIPEQPKPLSQTMIHDGVLTHFQAKQLLLGRYRGFNVGKYKILEQLGQGGMGAVYLCEHMLMRRRVAIKILPQDKASDPASLERFYREARAVAALDHPNIVRAHDIDQESQLHFLVMEYVDGHSLQDIVKKNGPMDVTRTTHYIRQAAIGLAHLHSAGLVHRDIKPGNLLLDRQGTIKILDMGLARSFRKGEESVTRLFDEKSVLGTADYLAPEQAMCSSEVDIRADIYSLGATWYFLLTSRAPFEEGSITQKLLWHQMRPPTPIASLRNDFPAELVAILEKMMAKDPAERYQEPKQIAELLEPWTQTAISAPPEKEMPHLCPAARMTAGAEGSFAPRPAAISATVTHAATIASKSNPVSAKRTSASSTAADAVQFGLSPVSSTTAGGPGSSGRLHGHSGPHSPTSVPRSGRPSHAVDTDAPSAHTDTRPSPSGRLSGDRRRKRRRILVRELLRKYRKWVYVGAGALGVFLISLVIVILSLVGLAGSDSSSRRTAGGGTAVITLVRKGTGDQLTLKSLNDALGEAEPGDRIVIKGVSGAQPILEDRLIATGVGSSGVGQRQDPAGPNAPARTIKERRDITIEADPELHGPVRWSPRPNLDPETPLISVASFPGLRLKGFLIDGKNRLNDLIHLQQDSPGFTLEDVELTGFTEAGVRLISASGTREKPITFREVTAGGGSATAAAIVFGAKDLFGPAFDPGGSNRGAPPNQQQQPARNAASLVSQYIRMEGCIFKGQLQTAVDVHEGVAEIDFFQNRVFHLDQAFLFHKAVPMRRVHMRVDSNTFCELKSVFHLEALAHADPSNQVQVRNNLFVKTEKLVMHDARSSEPAGVRAQWIWLNERDPLRDAPKGDRFFRKTFDVTGTPKLAVFDAFCDDAFKAFVNGAEVGGGDMAINPTKVWAFDVTTQIRPGRNVLAVQGINRAGPAGLLVRLRILGSDGTATTLVSDESWKVFDVLVDNWQKPEFRDDDWPRPRVLALYGAAIEKWRNLVWESATQDRWQDLNPPLIVSLAGNIRDAASSEGSIKLDIPAREVTIGADPRTPGQFLRYANNSPLARAGADNKAVGYPPY